MICGISVNALKRNSRLINLGRRSNIGQYIIESLVDKDINIGFGYKYGYY